MKTKPHMVYIPHTPAGSACVWLAADTEERAIENLLVDAAHMPYKTWENFKKRGYIIKAWSSDLFS